MIGSLFYLIGTFLVTIVFNVPMNDALETVDPEGADATPLGPAIYRGGRPGTTYGR